MRSALMVAVLGIAGCDWTSGDPGAVFSPEAVQKPEPRASTGGSSEEPAARGEGFDFEADAGGDEDGSSDLSQTELAARALNVEPTEATPVKPSGDFVPAKPPSTPPPPTTFLVPPSLDSVRLGWGGRLIDTLQSDPPMAYLGMPNGPPVLVKAGDLVPEVGIVVLAVGRDAVQVAEVVPEGDHARVEPRILSRLSP